jgi:hypothetical protein
MKGEQMSDFTGLLTAGTAQVEIGKLAKEAVIKALQVAYPDMIFKADISGVQLEKLEPVGFGLGIKVHLNVMPRTEKIIPPED